MGIFDFLNPTRPLEVSSDQWDILNEKTEEQVERQPPPEIKEEIFIEKPTPANMDQPENLTNEKSADNLQRLYLFLERNMEKKGYEDALINPDTSVMEEQIKYLKSEVLLYISKVKTYYSGYLRDIEFHIETRKRNGMVETVEELLTHQKNVANEYQTVLLIEDETNENNGSSQNLLLGYKIGFRNGFAAITYNSILGKH